MGETERYLSLRGEREGLVGKITGLKNQIVALKESLDPLEQEGLRLEILGDPQAGKKKAEFAKGRDRIRELEGELDQAEKKARIMSDLLPDFRHKARAELSDECRRTFGKAVAPFVKRLREAGKMEWEIVELRLAENKKFQGIDCGDCPIRAWEPILMKMSREYPSLPEFEVWVKNLEGQGFDIH